MEHSSTIRTSPEEGAFRPFPDQRPLSPVSEGHVAFSNEDLSFNSGGEIAIFWTTSPDQQLKRGSVMLGVGVFVWWSFALGGIIITSGKNYL